MPESYKNGPFISFTVTMLLITNRKQRYVQCYTLFSSLQKQLHFLCAVICEAYAHAPLLRNETKNLSISVKQFLFMPKKSLNRSFLQVSRIVDFTISVLGSSCNSLIFCFIFSLFIYAFAFHPAVWMPLNSPYKKSECKGARMRPKKI